MPENTPDFQKILQRAITLIEARIRYNEALQTELLTYNDQELLEFYCNYDRHFKVIIEKMMEKDDPESQIERQEFLAFLRLEYTTNATNVDIGKLKNIKSALAHAMATHDLFALVYVLHRDIEYEEYAAKVATYTSKEMAHKYPTLNSLDGSTFASNEDKLEHYTYKETYKLIEPLLTAREEEFISTYSEYHLINDTSCLLLTEKFPILIQRCMNRADDLEKASNKISKELLDVVLPLQSTLDAYRATLKTALILFNKQQEYKSEILMYSQEILLAYINVYAIKEGIKTIDTLLTQTSQEIKKFKEEQQRKSVAQATKEKKQAKTSSKPKTEQYSKLSATARAAEISTANDKAKQEEAARIQSENKEFQDAMTKKLKQRKAEIEAQRTQNEKEKHEQRAANTIQVVSTDSNGALQSTFKLPDSMVENNIEALTDILSLNCKSISFVDAKTMIERLGGTVESSGGSHHKIIFDAEVYSYIDKKNRTYVAGLPRPHGGETKLRNFELNLFKNALRSVVPDNLLKKIDDHNTPKPRAHP